MFVRTTLATLLVVSMTSLAAAQFPYADPYAARVNALALRQAQLASHRARAAVPVNYTFPIRRDLSGVYGAGIYPSVFGQYSTPYVQDGQVAYRPTATCRDACGIGCNSSAPYSSYYPQTTATSISAASPYYVGSSLAGPPKVYPKDQPIRNLFRYLVP